MNTPMLCALAFGALAATPALAMDVTRTATIAAPPATAWKAIGQFCGIGDLQPAVEKCVPSERDGRKVRTLSLKGGTIVEQERSRDEKGMAYTYAILGSPLPVEGYTSTLDVAPEDSGATLTWTGSFEAEGVPDAKAGGVIGGIHEGRLKSLSEKAK